MHAVSNNEIEDFFILTINFVIKKRYLDGWNGIFLYQKRQKVSPLGLDQKE